LEILDKLEVADQTLLAWTLNTLGKVTQVKDENDLADKYYSRSTTIWRALGDQTGLARALMDLATNYRWSGQPDTAIIHYKEAERLLSSTTNELDKTLVGINLGATYYDKEEWSLAEETFHKAYSPFLRKSGDLRNQALLSMNLGNVLLKSERLAEAEAFVRQAIDLWGQLDDDLYMANSIGALGEILVGQGQGEAAILLFDESITLFEKYPSHPRAIRSINFFKAEKQKIEDRLNN
jgi:tetratricopeptide (TPR) repeat protein